MKITKNQFRALIIAEIVVALLGGFYEFFAVDTLPAPLQDYLSSQYDDAGESGWTNTALMFCAILAIVVTVGLFMFKPWARLLNLIMWPVSFVATIAIGISITTGLGAALYELSIGISGVVLALTYYSPLKTEFERNNGPRKPLAAQRKV